MNGPQHYAEAERLLSHEGLDTVDPMPADHLLIACAQVHATLAAAAATIDALPPSEQAVNNAWKSVTA